jgi:inorganic pyrophosphatase
LDTLQDVDILLPGYIKSIRTWFEEYKIPEGKSRNKIVGEVLDAHDAMAVIKKMHNAYKELKSGAVPQNDMWLG